MGNPVTYLEREATFSGDVPVPPLSDDETANRLLGSDANAFLIGLILDQQTSSEKAFAGPAVLRRRMGPLNLRKIADMPQSGVCGDHVGQAGGASIPRQHGQARPRCLSDGERNLRREGHQHLERPARCQERDEAHRGDSRHRSGEAAARHDAAGSLLRV